MTEKRTADASKTNAPVRKSSQNPRVRGLSCHDTLRLAAATLLSDDTVRCWAAGHRVTEGNDVRLSKASVKLGLELIV